MNPNPQNLNQQNSRIGVQTVGGNTTIYNKYFQKEIRKFLGLQPFFLDSDKFKGREQALEELHRRLFSGKNLLLLVNGQGGMGKTTLAAKYFETYHKHYTHLAWVFAEASLLDALLVLGNAQNLGCDFPTNNTPEQNLAILLQDLANLNKPCLLVIDNANNPQELERYQAALQKVPNFHVLVTTRVLELEYLSTYKVDSLPKDKAKDVFTQYYPKHQSQEDILFENIYEAVGGNTLVIEILSKNLVFI
jgi:hypothetical protein